MQSAEVAKLEAERAAEEPVGFSQSANTVCLHTFAWAHIQSCGQTCHHVIAC